MQVGILVFGRSYGIRIEKFQKEKKHYSSMRICISGPQKLCVGDGGRDRETMQWQESNSRPHT